MSDIDEEIRSSLERLRALRENRNELVPISRLPLDIFLVIFSFCGVDASASKARSATLWRTPAAVCRRWREIALSYRSLWPADTRELVFQRFAKSRTLSPANPPSLPLVLNFPEVNKQIKKQVQHIRRLRAARYREAPISRLPPSLLCKIFTLCSNIPFEDRGERLSWEHRSLYWLTRVCHRWRQVAYGHPLLWNRIVTWDPPWIKKILTRSRDLNHALIIDWTEDFPGSCHLPLVLQEVSRVQSVTLRGSGSTLTRMFETLQSRQATELESLTLMDHRPRFHTIEDPPPSKPLGIFRLATPKLRTLSVSGFNIAWDSSLLRSSTLVNLALHRSTFGYPPTLTQLLDILDRTPRLETLTLGDLLPSKPYGVTYHQERWVRNMPHLKKIVLYSSCDSSGCCSLLEFISYPASTLLKVGCSCLEFPNSPRSLFTAVVVVQLRRRELEDDIVHIHTEPRTAPPLRRLVLAPPDYDPHGPGQYTLSAFTDLQATSNSPQLEFGFAVSHTLCPGVTKDWIAVSVWQMLASAIDILPCHSVEEIDLEGDVYETCDAAALIMKVPYEGWMNASRCLVHLKSLTLGEHWWDSLFKAMLQDCQPDRSGDGDSPHGLVKLFPQLKSITLQLPYTADLDRVLECGSSVGVMLLQVLRARRERGFGLAFLRIEGGTGRFVGHPLVEAFEDVMDSVCETWVRFTGDGYQSDISFGSVISSTPQELLRRKTCWCRD